MPLREDYDVNKIDTLIHLCFYLKLLSQNHPVQVNKCFSFFLSNPINYLVQDEFGAVQPADVSWWAVHYPPAGHVRGVVLRVPWTVYVVRLFRDELKQPNIY
jgi:hypothetical protein